MTSKMMNLVLICNVVGLEWGEGGTRAIFPQSNYLISRHVQ
jgi:hypothetical protein